MYPAANGMVIGQLMEAQLAVHCHSAPVSFAHNGNLQLIVLLQHRIDLGALFCLHHGVQHRVDTLPIFLDQVVIQARPDYSARQLFLQRAAV